MGCQILPMCHKTSFEIQEGAVFLADAHYNKATGERSLERFFSHLQNLSQKPPQLFLLGDIFDMLFGGVASTAKPNQEIIDAIENLAKEVEVFYFEGNHDFRVEKFFSKNITVFPFEKQPALFTCKNKKALLAHGDFDAPLGYRLYTKWIRNPLTLYVLNIYNSITDNSVLRYVQKHMDKKEQCREFEWFGEFVQKRVQKPTFECDIYIDGHFHQNKIFQLKNIKYINLGAFACNQRYFVVKFSNNEIVLEENTLP